MRREVEGLPREWTQAPLPCGSIDRLCNKLHSHLVVRHLCQETAVRGMKTKKKCFCKIKGGPDWDGRAHFALNCQSQRSLNLFKKDGATLSVEA